MNVNPEMLHDFCVVFNKHGIHTISKKVEILRELYLYARELDQKERNVEEIW